MHICGPSRTPFHQCILWHFPPSAEKRTATAVCLLLVTAAACTVLVVSAAAVYVTTTTDASTSAVATTTQLNCKGVSEDASSVIFRQFFGLWLKFHSEHVFAHHL